jgi:hypothetical protein
MSAGSLKMWNVERGFGFIQDDAGARICFCTSLRCKTPAFLRIASSKAIDLFTKSAPPAMEGRKPAMFGGRDAWSSWG